MVFFQSYGGYLSDVNGTQIGLLGFWGRCNRCNTIYAGVIDAYNPKDGGVFMDHIKGFGGGSGGGLRLASDHHAVIPKFKKNEIVFANLWRYLLYS
ncbi:MAG: hypothetical protein CM15mP23_23100 [Cryomorphaceae bacterium]|nr:MAG: hypothetical protein CM15mP23_23100 [Cryomorphaceae bacterium]